MAKQVRFEVKDIKVKGAGVAKLKLEGRGLKVDSAPKTDVTMLVGLRAERVDDK